MNLASTAQYYGAAAYDVASDLQLFPARVSRKACEATGYSTLQSFLSHIGSYGAQLQCNFEVDFDGIEGMTMFVQSINLPGSKQNTCEIYHDGIQITLPVNFEPEHEFSFTVLNDARGFIYPTIKSYIALDALNRHTDSGKNMRVKVLTGQIEMCGVQPYPGAVFECYGVRLTGIGGISFDQAGTNVQTFDVSGKMIDYSYLPGKAKAGNMLQSWLNRFI